MSTLFWYVCVGVCECVCVAMCVHAIISFMVHNRVWMGAEYHW